MSFLVLQFNNKMSHALDQDQTQMALSPKQIEHQRFQTFTLTKIDHEIQKILSLNSLQNQHYKESIEKISFIENTYQRQNKQIKEALTILKEQHETLEKIYLSLRGQFQDNLLVCQSMQQQNKFLQKEVSKLKAMVSNQQGLIDEYRKSIEEEIALQKQLIKSQCEQQKAKLTKSFNRALQQLQKQYEEKFKKTQKQQKIKDYRNQFKQTKQYLISREISKSNLNQKTLKPSNSEYSTLDQESKTKEKQTKGIQLYKGQYDQQNRHNQPVFIV